MTRTVIAALLAAAATTAAVPSARAAGPLDGPPALVVSGRGPATAILHVGKPLTLDLANATASSSGDYAGIAIMRGRDLRGAALTVPRFTSPGVADPAYVTTNTLTLGPGNYTVHLLADGTADVRVPIDRTATIGLVADTPSRQRFADLSAGEPAAGTAVSARAKPRWWRSWTIAVSRAAPVGPAVGAVATLCLPAPGRDCQQRDPRRSVEVATEPLRLTLAAMLTGDPELLTTLTGSAMVGADVKLAFVQFD